MSARPNPAMDLLAALPVDGGIWGETAADFQKSDAAAVLDPDGPPFTWCGRPRGGRKTADAAGIAVALHLTVAPRGATSYCVAADAAQAGLVLDSVRGFVLRAPVLKERVRVEARRIVFLSDGEPVGWLHVLPADEASAYGLRPWVVIADELAVWPIGARGLWAAVVSALPKVEGSRLIVLTSAGDPAHFSYGVLKHARTSTQWTVNEVMGPLPFVTDEQLAEQRALLTDSQYARLHLNLWQASEDRLVSVDNLAAAVTLDGPQEYRSGVRYRMGLDLGLTHDATAVAVAHAELDPSTDPPSRRIVLDRLVTFQGRKDHPVRLADVEQTVHTLWRHYGRPRLRADPFQAAGLVQSLRARGVGIEEWPYTASRYGQMASSLFALLRDKRIDLYDDEGLLDELRNVRLQETIPGQLRIQHDPGRHDDRCVAIGMAIVPLVERSMAVARISVATGRLPSTTPTGAKAAASIPATPVVQEGAERPVEKLTSFAAARRDPRWQPPRRRV